MRLKLMVTGALAGLALIGPANAAAAPTVSDVRERLEKAQSYLDYSAWAAEMGNAAHADAAVTAFARVASRAEELARRVDGVTAKARAMRAVARVDDTALDTYADILDEIPAHVQAIIAEAVAISAEARESAFAVLTRLVERLPEPARTAVLDAIARFSSDGDVEALVQALSSDTVIDGVKAVISEHLDQITAHLDSLIATLEGLGVELPPAAHAAITEAIEMITAQLDGLADMIDEILGSLPIGGLPGGVTDDLCDLIGGFPIPVPGVCN